MTRPAYPPARRLDLTEDRHGHRVADPYRWLEDGASGETRAWSEAQAALLTVQRSAWPHQAEFRRRITELLRAGVVSAPAWRRDRQFFMRRTSEQEHAILLTVDPGGTERVLIDPMATDPNGTTTLDAWQPSKEGHLLAYQLSVGGTEESVVQVMDVMTGAAVDGPIDRARYSPIAWLPGGKAFYYVRRLAPGLVPSGEEQYHRRVWLHRLGTDPADDVLVFGEGGEKTRYYDVSVSIDGRWLVVSASSGTAPRNDLWIADLTDSPPESPHLRVVQEEVDAQTMIRVGRDGRLYVLTDRDAPRGRLCVTSPENPAYSTWRDLVGQDPQAVLHDYAILDAGAERPVLLASWTRHATSEVTVHDLASGEQVGQVPLPGLGSIGGLMERPEGGHESWFSYTDHTTPSEVLRYDASTGGTTVWATPPGTVAVPAVRTQQVTYTSRDGTPVRMFVIARPDSPDAGPMTGPAAGPRPAILYGYGGFGAAMTPAYASSILAWVEAGGVYAVANLRGGSEEGEDWHRAGMGAHKQNVFDDFIAAAEWLIGHGYTTSAQLAISGGSNGGLLVGAALTQRPEIFAAAVCSAPLLDMVRYEQFGLGSMWSEEYGRADDPAELGWLLAYSPYHHVRPGADYPAVMFQAFDADTRVDPMHARKMCAALQHATSGDRPILLRLEAEVGHGARALSRSVDLSVDTLAFLAAHTGLSTGEER